MNKTLIVASLLVLPALVSADDDLIDLESSGKTAAAANQTIQNPSSTPEQREEAAQQKAESVKKIESIGDRRQDNADLQLKVGKTLASVDEGKRAVPYAEKGLALAERSGDQKLVREALLIGSEVYIKAGRYDLAKDRAQRILKDNPRDRDAMALYMQVKDRAGDRPARAATPPQQAAAPPPAAPAAAPPLTGSGMASEGMRTGVPLDSLRFAAIARQKLALDPKAALASFDKAVELDPKNAPLRVERSKARLQSGDPVGARTDANAAIKLDGNLGAAFMARALADRALGAAEKAIIADYQKAAEFDGGFAKDYEAILERVSGGSGTAPVGESLVWALDKRDVSGRSASDMGRNGGMPSAASAKEKPLLLIVSALGLACAVAAVLLFLRRKTDETPVPGATPRP